MDQPTTDAELQRFVLDFTEAFNLDDLDGVMACFAEDSLYDEFHGCVHRGKAAIRAAFEPQFRGDFGTIRFRTEDVFGEVATGKALVRWLCVIEKDGRSFAWRGLDLLRVKDGLLVEKHTYAKAPVPRWEG